MGRHHKARKCHHHTAARWARMALRSQGVSARPLQGAVDRQKDLPLPGLSFFSITNGGS